MSFRFAIAAAVMLATGVCFRVFILYLSVDVKGP